MHVKRAVRNALRMSSAAAAIGAMLPGLANAEPQAQPAETRALEEVTVTAQRREELVEKVPMSIAVVTPEALESAGITNVHELNRLVAGAQINFAGGFTQPAIRGITTLTNGMGFENNVAIYIDGFYSPDTVTINGDLVNIASVEVLKGPQGTLWGRNATGGAILINTLAPSDTLTGKLQVGYERFNDRSVAGHISGPLGERVRYSVAGYYREGDGYNELIASDGSGRKVGDATPQRQESVRVKLEADVTDSLVATLAYNYGLSDDARGLLFSTFEHAPASLPAPPFRADEPYTASYNSPTRDQGTTNEGTLKLEYETAVGTLTSYSGYANRSTRIGYDFDGTFASLFSSTELWTQDTYQQTLDWRTTAFDRIDLVVGGTYYNDRLEANYRNNVSATLLNTTYEQLEAEAYAVYLDATYKIADSLSLNVGGRYNQEEKSIEYRQTTPAGVNVVPPVEKDADFDGFTPRASLTYEIGPLTTVYASYSQGFRSGAFNPAPATNPAFVIPIKPEQIDAFEVGFKTAGDYARFDVAVFYYDYTDLQVGITAPNPVCSTCGVVILISNAKGAEVYGLDTQVTFTPVDHLTVRAGAAYLHARYSDFSNATGTGLNATSGLNVSGQPQNWTDQEMARSPEFSGFVNVDYDIPVGFGSLLLGASANYTDSYVLSNPSLYGPAAGALANEQRFRQDSYTLVNAQATWSDPSERYSVTVFGKNLTDKEYLMTYNGGGYGDYRSFAAPRTYGIRVGYKF